MKRSDKFAANRVTARIPHQSEIGFEEPISASFHPGEAKGAARRRTAEQSIGKGGMVGMENNKIRKSIMLNIFKEETK